MDLMDHLRRKQDKYMSKILKSRRNSEATEHPTIIPVPGDQGLKIRITLPSRRPSEENEPTQSSKVSTTSTSTAPLPAIPTTPTSTATSSTQEPVSPDDQQPSGNQKTSPLTVWNLCKSGNQKRLTPASVVADQTSSPVPGKAPAEQLISPEAWLAGSSRCRLPTTPGVDANVSSGSPHQVRSMHDSPKNVSAASANLCSPWGEGIQDLFSDSWKSSPSPLSLQQPKTSLDFSSTAG